jgi:hypothetical protein
VVTLSVVLVWCENWLGLGPQFQVEEEVIKIDGCRKIVGQLLAESQWGVESNSSFIVMMISEYFYSGLIHRQRGKNNICHAPLVTY